MICTKEDCERYIKADFDAQAMEHPLIVRFTYGENWTMFKYMKTLRKLEYYINSPSLFGRICKVYYLLKHRKNCLKYGIHISPNVVEEGYKIVHPGFRRIDEVVGHIGKNCTFLPMVLLGKKKPEVALGA